MPDGGNDLISATFIFAFAWVAGYATPGGGPLSLNRNFHRSDSIAPEFFALLLLVLRLAVEPRSTRRAAALEMEIVRFFASAQRPSRLRSSAVWE